MGKEMSLYKKGSYQIESNRHIAEDVYQMDLLGDTRFITAPGQFVNIALDGFYLRRPISVCDWDERGLTIIYKAVGRGTGAMAALAAGVSLDLLTGLGNGFDPTKGERPLLVGGGVGVPPLYGLAKALRTRGARPTAVLGFNSARDVFYEAEFAALGIPVILATADGSAGVRGFITDAIREAAPDFDYLYTCGPLPMLRALYEACPQDGQFSFEERMGCGFGACMGCTCQTVSGPKRICKEGPVLTRDDILW